MRKIRLFYLLFLCLIAIAVFSCKDNEDNKGKVEFGASIIDDAKKKSGAEFSIDDVKSAVVTIENSLGEVIYESEKIDFYKFNDDYVTEPLSLVEGSYKLKKYYLLNESEQVIYATPIGTSPLAYLVTNPLVISFDIIKDEVTELNPEVLATNGYNPEDFGYVSFGINEVDVIDLLLTVFEYNAGTDQLDIISADVIIKNADDTLYNNTVDPLTNKITINDDYTSYEVMIQKSGYISYNYVFTRDSLIQHYNKPLTIILDKVDLADGLVAYYPFSSNTNDFSGYDNHAINYGASLTNDRFGVANSAYDFDGINNYMIINHTENLNFDSNINSYTLSFWVKGNSSEISPCRVISKWNELLGTPYPFQIDADLSNFKFVLYNGSSTKVLELGFAWETNWHNLIFVVNKENNTISCYLDNVLISNMSYSSFGTTVNSTDIYIGGFPGFSNGDRYYHGMMDDIRFYNRAITEQEIQILYHEGGWDE